MDKNTNSKRTRKVENKGYMITDMELGDDMNDIIYMYEEKPFSDKDSNEDTRGNKDKKD
jgi:hypothetical protein